jgi:hypothetical protein
MAVIRISGFTGENRALHPMLLGAQVGTTSLNQKPGRGDLRPWRAPLTVATVGAGRKTIYRMGRDTVSDTDYWLSWTGTVAVVRGYNSEGTAERTYYTGDGAPKWTDTNKALAGSPPTASRALGVPAPSGSLSFEAAGGTGVTELRFYAITFVTDADQESAPGTPVSISCPVDAAVTISGMATAPSGDYGINRLRLYRTETGSTGSASFFFLRELGVGTTSTTDDLRTLGEVLPTTTWLPAPGVPQGGASNLTEPTLHGLIPMWNGMLAGISGRGVRFCEAFVPYAWPIGYEIEPADYSPVALGVFGQTLVVLTNGKPGVIVGGSPESLDEQPVEFLQACVSARSVVSMGHGVAWAAPDGLAYIGSGGARIITAGLMTRDDWQALSPATMTGAMFEGRYFGFYEVGGLQRGFCIDPLNPSGLYFFDFGIDAVYVDDLQAAMYVLNGSSIKKWDAGAALSTTFRSKVFDLGRAHAGFACAEVIADAYPVTFKLYADGALVYTVAAANRRPFRLPGGYSASSVQVQIQSSGAVQGVVLAHSMAELAQA